MTVSHLNMENFRSFIEADKIVVVDFWASWCGPCRMIAPLLEKLSSNEGIEVGKVDIDENDALAEAFNVTSIPTLLLFKNGKLLDKRVGYMSYESLKSWVLNNAQL